MQEDNMQESNIQTVTTPRQSNGGVIWIVLLVVFYLGVAGLGVWAIVVNGKLNEAQAQYADAQNQLADSQAQYQDLQSKNTALQADHTALQGDYDKLTADNTQTKADLAKSQDQVKYLQTKLKLSDGELKTLSAKLDTTVAKAELLDIFWFSSSSRFESAAKDSGDSDLRDLYDAYKSSPSGSLLRNLFFVALVSHLITSIIDAAK